MTFICICPFKCNYSNALIYNDSKRERRKRNEGNVGGGTNAPRGNHREHREAERGPFPVLYRFFSKVSYLFSGTTIMTLFVRFHF